MWRSISMAIILFSIVMDYYSVMIMRGLKKQVNIFLGKYGSPKGAPPNICVGNRYARALGVLWSQ